MAIPPAAVVTYVPATWLVSLGPTPVGLELDGVAACWSAGTTPWKAGTFLVTAVNCQALPVRPSAGLAPGPTLGATAALAAGTVPEPNVIVPPSLSVSISTSLAIA